MKIKVNSVLVDELDEALKSYTEVLGFIKKQKHRAGISNGQPLPRPKRLTLFNWSSSQTATRPPRPAKEPFLTREFPQGHALMTSFKKSMQE
jgi:hypothetical protein